MEYIKIFISLFVATFIILWAFRKKDYEDTREGQD